MTASAPARFGAMLLAGMALVASPLRAQHGAEGPAPAASPAAGRDSAASRDAAAPAWVTLPETRPGAILPAERIVAFYGNPRSTRMGILGEIPPARMMAKLDSIARVWAAADTTRGLKPALHLIATVAQADAGRDGLYRLRMPDGLIDTVHSWAKQRGWLFFLDVQPGRSTVQAELPRLRKWLADPSVHLALDPEFTMPPGTLPGKRIGTMDAADINHAVTFLEQLVDSLGLPPKLLVVHRFTDRMVTNAGRIRRGAKVQVIVDMDGFGSPQLKLGTWRRVVVREPVQYTGLKLFFKNDKPMLTPQEVLRRFSPAPLYIQYQ